MDKAAGFPPYATMGPSRSRSVPEPFLPGRADGGAISDESAARLGFPHGIEEPNMLRRVGTLLHVNVHNSPKGSDFTSLLIDLDSGPRCPGMGGVAFEARAIVEDRPITRVEPGPPPGLVGHHGDQARIHTDLMWLDPLVEQP